MMTKISVCIPTLSCAHYCARFLPEEIASVQWIVCDDGSGDQTYEGMAGIADSRSFHAEQQGIDRAIPYFTDKLNYLDAYRFEDLSIESIRRSRFSETQLLLGLRLIEQGETDRGRELIHLGRSASERKAMAGLALSYVPKALRRSVFGLIRSLAPANQRTILNIS